MQHMNPIDKLEALLTEAGIPFEREKVEYPDANFRKYAVSVYGEAGKWLRNQIIYRRDKSNRGWKFDAIWQFGSWGLPDMVECYGSLIKGDPKPMTAEEAFEIILNDWNGMKSGD